LFECRIPVNAPGQYRRQSQPDHDSEDEESAVETSTSRLASGTNDALNEVSEAITLGALLAHPDLVPDGFVIEGHTRYDRVLDDHHQSVRVRPEGVDPETFNFGTPGAYASLTAVPTSDDRYGYHVHVFSTRVAWTFQQAGHVVTFTDEVDAIHAAVSLVQSEIVDQDRATSPK
jgi:hypothetical protein